MEHKELFAVIIAAFGVIALIGLLTIVRGGKKEPADDAGTQAQTTPIVLTTAKTDIWDVLHDQQNTTTTPAETDENGSAVTTMTGEDGTPVTDETGTSPEGDLPADSGAEPAETAEGETLPADTAPAQTAAESTAPVTEAQPGFTIVVAPN